MACPSPSPADSSPQAEARAPLATSWEDSDKCQVVAQKENEEVWQLVFMKENEAQVNHVTIWGRGRRGQEGLPLSRSR